MMRRWTVLVLILAGALFGVAVSASASASAECGESVGLNDVVVACEYTAQSVQEQANADTEAVYTVVENCHSADSDPAVCNNPRACTVNGTPGTWNSVRRNGVPIGKICSIAGDPTTFTPSLPVLIAKRFKALEWPQSTLSVQPRDGKTLVNIETIFYTTNNQPTTKTVTLLGQQIEIRATPTSYTWHFGDDTSSSTSSAGHAYPDHDVFHVYTGLDPVKPSVDTVYSGAFRVNGGEWENIEDTLTVAGARVDLEILEASPELVTDPGE